MLSVLELDSGYTIKYTPPPSDVGIYLTVHPSSCHNTDTFSITKHNNIEINLSSIAQSTGQYFSVLLCCQSNTEIQIFQYRSFRKLNAGYVIENVCIVT